MSKDLHGAVLAIQSEIGTLQKNAINPHFKSKYISLDSLVEHVQPLLTKHGLIWVCRPAEDADGRPSLDYALIHAESSQSMGGEMPLLLEKQNAQGLGSAITYARRYALCAVLNIVADVDDDGEKATKSEAIATINRVRADLKKESDFASQVRATGKTGAQIRKWLSDEGFTLDEIGLPGELKNSLNDLQPARQKQLLAWANG
jgi:hypothetical protein